MNSLNKWRRTQAEFANVFIHPKLVLSRFRQILKKSARSISPSRAGKFLFFFFTKHTRKVRTPREFSGSRRTIYIQRVQRWWSSDKTISLSVPERARSDETLGVRTRPTRRISVGSKCGWIHTARRKRASGMEATVKKKIIIKKMKKKNHERKKGR